MASTIRARIQLDGAEEVSNQLKQLKIVFTDTGKAFEAVGNSFSNIVSNVERTLIAFAKIEAAALAVTAVFSKLGKSAADQIDDIGDAADAVGLSVEEYQRLSGAAEAAGVAGSSITKVFRKLSIDIEEASKGTGKLTENYKKFGIELTDSGGKAKSFTDVLKQIANIYFQLDAAKRPDFLKTLGFRAKDAAELAQLLGLGADGIEQFINESEKLKYIPTDEDNEIVARSIAAASLLKDAWQKFSIEVGKAFIPLSTNIDTGLTKVIVQITEPLSRVTNYIASQAKPIISDFFAMLTGGSRFNNIQFVVWQVQLESLLDRFRSYYALYIEPFISGLVKGLSDGFNFAVTVIQTAINTVSSILSNLGIALQPVKDILATFITPETIGYITGFAATLMIVLIPAINAITPVVSLVIGTLGLLASVLGPGGVLFAAVFALTGLFVLNFDTISQKTNEVFSSLSAIVLAGLDNTIIAVSNGLDRIKNIFFNIFDNIKSTLSGWFDWLTNALSNALSGLSNLASKAAEFVGLGSGSGATGFASGGYVSGPGSATSDSIPAWLSNGEFVVQAAAVRRFGVDFFRRLNGMSVDPSALYGRYGFASGGLVAASIGAASGGSGGKTFNLVIDGRSFNGLSGSSSTINDLEKYASIRQLSATAKRAPSRIG